MASRVKPPALTKIEQLEILKKEFENLKRQQKAFENECLMFKQEAKGLLERQKRDLEYLQKQREELNVCMQALKSPLNERINGKEDKEIVHLLKQYEMYMELIKTEKYDMEGQETMIKKDEKVLKELWLERMRGFDPQKELIRLYKGNKILTNRLEVATVKYNKMVAKNRELRKQISDLLYEREMFDKMQHELEANMVQCKKKMNKMVEEIKLNFSITDEHYGKYKYLQLRNKTVYRNLSDEMKELNRLYENNKKLKEILNQVNMKRGLTALQAKKEEKKLNKRLDMQEWTDYCKRILTAVKTIKKEVKKDEITKRFIHQESLNISNLYYLNVLRSEKLALRERVKEIRDDVDNERSAKSARSRIQEQKLSKLENELEEEEERSQKAELEAEEMEKTMCKLLKGTMEVYRAFKCSNPLLKTVLGENEEVNVYNYKMFVEILENRVQQVVSTVLFLQKSGVETVGKPSKSIVKIRRSSVRRPSATSAFDLEHATSLILPKGRDEITVRVKSLIEDHKNVFKMPRGSKLSMT